MKYIMVTSWDNHWNKLRDNRTLFTLGMIRWDLAKNKTVDNTDTLFIKKHRITKEMQKCWAGKVHDFRKVMYKDKEAISFAVKLEEIVNCPVKYLDYSEGWYCEEDDFSERSLDSPEVKSNNEDIWSNIQEQFGIGKHKFGKKINFVKDSFKRDIIFRDVEQAYRLLKLGFCKPAVILSGGVIEELLRLYLESKNIKSEKDDFTSYLKSCEKHGLLKLAVQKLTGAVKDFRNFVHLKKETEQKHAISKSTASMAVASIFTIASDF